MHAKSLLELMVCTAALQIGSVELVAEEESLLLVWARLVDVAPDENIAVSLTVSNFSEKIPGGFSRG